jgi:hypothetical protein
MMNETDKLSALREGIADACTGAGNVCARTGESYPMMPLLPYSHMHATDIETILVEGYCGAGKSYLCQFISRPQIVTRIGFAHRSWNKAGHLQAAYGYGTGAQIPADGPDRATLADFLRSTTPDFSTVAIWRAVLAKQLPFTGPLADLPTWQERTAWIHANPKEFEAQLKEIIELLRARNTFYLVLFDGLDQIADNWDDTLKLLKGLLQVAREARDNHRIRCKLFFRPDMMITLVSESPDAVKLWPYKQTIHWQRADVFALFFHRLANHPAASEQINEMVIKAGMPPLLKNSGINYYMLADLRTDEELQTKVFHALAGNRMGDIAPYGSPYIWLANYLQDSNGFVSPSSLLAALGAAVKAVDPACKRALDWRAIATGVREGWRVRMAEIDADHPWVKLVMQPLMGKLSLPFLPQDMETIWDQQNTLATLAQTLKAGDFAVKLPPRRLNQGAKGVIDDLAALGILQILLDGRIQMNDLYRRPFGFGRKGGINLVSRPTAAQRDNA